MNDDMVKADRMYRTRDGLRSRWQPVVKEPVEKISDVQNLSAEDREKLTDDFAYFAYDARLRDNQAAQVFGLLARHVRKPADDATVQEWNIEVNKRIREEFVARFGQREADRRLAIAKEFVSKRANIAAMLRTSGVGSNAALVLPLVENADELHMDPSRPKPLDPSQAGALLKT